MSEKDPPAFWDTLTIARSNQQIVRSISRVLFGVQLTPAVRVRQVLVAGGCRCSLYGEPTGGEKGM
jgi:hypothetical protein